MDVETFDPDEPENDLVIKEDNHLDLSKHRMIQIYLKQYTYLRQSEVMKNWGKITNHLPYKKMPKKSTHNATNV